MIQLDDKIKRIKSLLNPPQPKNKKQRPRLTPTLGNWSQDNEWCLVGVDHDGVYRLTWKNKTNEEIGREQSIVNHEYVNAVNPDFVMQLINEYERLLNERSQNEQ